MTKALLSVFTVMFLAAGCGPSSEPTPGTEEGTASEARPGEGRVYEMALCGSGLQCSASSVSGATGCQQYTGGPTIYCCPSGYGISNGACVPPCGSGLQCSASSVSGSGACQQYTGGPTVYCCPSGYGLVNNTCVPPCGTGLSCGASPAAGSNICVQSSTSKTAIYCCSSGRTYSSSGCH